LTLALLDFTDAHLRHHRMQQYHTPGVNVLGRDGLDRVVAEAILAGDDGNNLSNDA
jgi:hypothetical protein